MPNQNPPHDGTASDSTTTDAPDQQPHLDYQPPEAHAYNENPPADYDPIPLTTRSNHPVLQSEFIAWKVLLAPDDHDGFYRSALIKRGLEYYRADHGAIKQEQFLADVQEFALTAATGVDRNALADDPWLKPKRPGQLATLYAAAALGMKHAPAIDAQPSQVSFQYAAGDALLGNLYGMLDAHPRTRELQQYAAETVFGCEVEDDRGPPPGRTVTDLTQLEDQQWYFEIPLTHASRHALGRSDTDSPITSLITNNCIYVPYWQLTDELEQRYLRDGPAAKQLQETYKGMNPEHIFQQFLNNITRINEHVEQIKKTNRTSLLRKDQRYPEQLRCVLKMVTEAPPEHAALDTRVTASEVLSALNWATDQIPTDADNTVQPPEAQHSTITSHEQEVVSEFETPQGVTAFLKQHSEHEDIQYIKRDHPKPNQFVLSYQTRNFKQIDVQSPNDLFELPCVANLEEYFFEHPPDRQPLYFLVRIMASLDNRFTREDIAKVFTRFPWYDPATTWYQVGYELDQEAVPIGCNNDNTEWSHFCIGRSNCDYSIYGSLPIRDDVLERLE